LFRISLADDRSFQSFPVRSLAQVTLLSPLSKAAQAGRGAFLKSEAFRMLSLLLSTKPDPDSSSDLDKVASRTIYEGGKEVVTAITAALEDDEMRKAKRVRVVLKAMEKFVTNLSPSFKGASKELLNALAKVTKVLGELSKSESGAVQGLCTKLVSEIESKTKELSETAVPKPKAVTEVKAVGDAKSQSQKASKKKKSKKKK
jgi:hypothetical protein